MDLGKEIPVNVINELNNIIGINLMHLHKLTYDLQTRLVIFTNFYPNDLSQ
jgi:hypothetical protein